MNLHIMYGKMPSNIQFNQLKKIIQKIYQKHKISEGLLVCRIERMGQIIIDRGLSNEICRYNNTKTFQHKYNFSLLKMADKYSLIK